MARKKLRVGWREEERGKGQTRGEERWRGQEKVRGPRRNFFLGAVIGPQWARQWTRFCRLWMDGRTDSTDGMPKLIRTGSTSLLFGR